MRITFNSADYLRLRSILPVLKRHGIKKFDWHPDGTVATFFGDPLAATNAAFENGDITKPDADFIYNICHPSRAA